MPFITFRDIAGKGGDILNSEYNEEEEKSVPNESWRIPPNKSKYREYLKRIFKKEVEYTEL